MTIEATAIYPDGSEELLVTYDLNMTKIMEKEVMKKETTTKPKLALSFELSRSHLFQLLSAKANVDETVMEEIVKPEKVKKEDKKKTTSEETSDAETDVEEKNDEEASEEKSEDDSDAEKASEETNEEAAEETSDAEPEKEYEEKIVPLTFTVDQEEKLPNLRLLTKDQKKDASKRIKAL